jgi:hypothetical protein
VDQASYDAELRDAISRYLPHAGLPLLPSKDHERWTPRLLVAQAVVMSWALADTLASAFAQAWAVVRDAYDSRRAPGADHAGFARHLARDSAALLGVVAPELRRHVRRVAGTRGHWVTHRWPAFGVDGSKFDCPRTAANRAAFGDGGKRNGGPQQFVTTVFHLASGLVWGFCRGDARASERAHLRAMLPTLPDGCLLVADAGFVGYDLFRAALDSGRHVLVRVGANVRLLTELGWCVTERAGTVYLWPKGKRAAGEPPLTLRLVTLLDGRNRRVHLLTDVLAHAEMTDAEAGRVYRQRWGVELIYRSLKQTMGKRKLRSRSPAQAAAELEWAVVAFWMLGLITLERTLAAGHAPDRVSVAAALRAVRTSAQRGRRRADALSASLASALKDRYLRARPKTARAWPHKKKDKPPGDPKARKATEAEIDRARALLRERVAA